MERLDIEHLRSQLGPVARPRLMSIGDSLYNGMRSMTINAELAHLAPAALLAEAFGWSFTVPDYPRNVLFDLEALYRSPAELIGIVQAAVANARAWDSDSPWSQSVFFDNVAIAGLRIEQLDDPDQMSYATEHPKILSLISEIEASHTLPTAQLADLHMAINGS